MTQVGCLQNKTNGLPEVNCEIPRRRQPRAIVGKLSGFRPLAPRTGAATRPTTLPPISMEPDRRVLEDHFPVELTWLGSMLIGGRVEVVVSAP